MKKFTLWLAALAFFALTGCSDDDETPDTGNPNLIEAIEGSYKGYSSGAFQYSPTPIITADETVVIRQTKDEKGEVVFNSSQWGDFKMSELEVTVANNVYTLTGSGKVSMAMNGGTPTEYPYTFTGTVKSKDDASFEFKVPAVMGGLTITVVLGEVPGNLAVTGSYEGYSKGTFQYSPTPVIAADETVVIRQTTDGKIEAAFNSSQWGKFLTSDLEVTVANKVYTLSGSGKVSMGMDGGADKEYSFTLTGTVKSTEDASFEFKVPAVMGGLTVSVVSGDVPAYLAVMGSYDGYTKAVFQYSPTPVVTADETLAITAKEDGTADLAFTSSQWGTFTGSISEFQPIATQAAASGYTVSGSGKVSMAMNGGTPTEYSFTVAGTIKSTDDAVLTFTIPGVMGGLTLTYNTGDVPNNLAVMGTYKGYTKAIFQYSPNPMITADETLTITAKEDGTADLACTSSQWGDFVIAGLEITAVQEGGYTVSGSGKVTMGMSEESKKEYSTTLSGTITSTTEAAFKFSVPAVMGGMTVELITGDAPAE